MADRDYVIRILLKAEDDTAAAVAKATGQLEAFQEASKQAQREQAQLSERYKETADNIERGNASLEKQQRLYKDRVRDNKSALDAQVELEKAAERYARVVNSNFNTEAQQNKARLDATEDLKKAEEDLAKQIEGTYKTSAKRARDQAAAQAANARAIAEQTAATRELAGEQKKAAEQHLKDLKEEDRQARENAANRKKFLDLLDKTEADIDKRQKARIRETEAEQKKADDDRLARRKKLDAILDQSDREAAQREKRLFDEKISRYDAEDRHIKQLEDARHRAAIQKRRELDQILDRSDREAAQREERLFRDKISRYDREDRELKTLLARRKKDAEEAAREEADRPLKQAQAQREYAKAIDEVAKARRRSAQAVGDDRLTRVEKVAVDADTRAAEIKLDRVAVRAVEIGALHPNIQVDADVGAAVAKLILVEEAAKRAGNSGGESGNVFKRFFTEVSSSAENAAGKAAAFDNVLRGLVSLGIAAFLQQIVVLGGAAAGALTALASSAVYAGAALGGALAAGAAQAIPVLGVLAAAMSRIKAVTDAVKQANLLQQQQASKSADQDKKQANAADSIAAAQDALADAHRRVQQAQEGLTQAREDARQKLEDLILAERGATLSATEAQAALRKAIRQGDTEDIDRARLRVDETQLQQRRTRSDLTERQGEGIEGAPEVTKAKEGILDAERAVRNAQRQLDRAKRSADAAADSSLAAAEKLQFLLSKLSPAERRLYTAMKNLQDQFREVAQNFTEPLINATTHAVHRISDLLNNPGLIADARKLSGGLAAQFRRITDSFTSNEMVGRMRGFMGQARQNLAPLTTIILNLSKSFFNVAEAAGPALNRIIRWVRDLSKALLDSTDKGKKSGDLGKFFQTGVTHLQAWVRLLGSIGKLFLAIAGPGGGAHTGLGIVNDLTAAFRKMAKAIEDPTSSTHKFFQDFFRLSRQIMREIGPVLAAVGKEFKKTFNQDGASSVHAFAQLLINVLIPGIGTFIRFIGHATTVIGNFLEEHPKLAKFVGTLVAMFASFTVAARVLTLLAPIGTAIKFIATEMRGLEVAGAILKRFGGLFKQLIEFLPGGSRLISIFVRIAGTASRFAGPFALISGVIFLLLQRFGLLDDVLRGAQSAWSRLVDRIRGPFKELQDSFHRLVAAFQGSGGLMPVLKILANFIARVLIETLLTLGETLGDILDAAFTFIGGFMDVLTGILTLDPGMFKKGMLKIGEAVVEGLFAPIKGIGKLFVRIFLRALQMIGEFLGIASPSKKFMQIGHDLVNGLVNGLVHLPGRIANAIKSGFNLAIDFLKKLPGRFANLAKDAVTGLASGFKNLGEKLWQGLGAIGNFERQIAQGIAKFIDKLLPNKIGPIPLPDNPLHSAGAYNVGGPVGGSGSGDVVSAMLEPGEFVVRKQAVQKYGLALFQMLNGGAGGNGPGFANGGLLGQAGNRDVTRAQASLSINAEADVGALAQRWRKMWAEIVSSTRRNSQTVEARIRTFRVNIEATTTRLSKDWHEHWRRMTTFAEDQSADMIKKINTSLSRLSNATFDTMSYVATATNSALKAFDADPVKINIERPKTEGKASGGWVGSAGERGRDAVPTLLGRGEAVLNWSHQKVVNSALWNQYGMTLDELFKRNNGFHAGGLDAGAFGFAQGGFTGPAGSGSAFTAIANFAKKKFGLTMTAGRTNHGYNTSTGNVSDHSWGGAGDFSDGYHTPHENAFNQFWLKKAPQVIKQLIWEGKDQQRGFPISDHFDHVHLAVKRELAFDLPKMAKIISRAARGLDIADLLSGVTDGEGSPTADHVDKPKITSTSKVFARLLRKLASKAIAGANAFIDKQFAKTDPSAGSGGPMHGENYDGPLDRIFPDHTSATASGHVQLRPEQVVMLAQKAGLPGRTFEQIAHGESNYYPGVISSDGGYGLWQMTPRVWGPAGVAVMNKLGGLAAMLNPWKNALMAKYLYQAAGNSIRPWYGTKFVTGHAQGGWPQFAEGGTVPGGPGQPVPIVAHAGEWIVNQMQQSKIAGALGTSIDRLRGFMGFTGGPTSFAGGGEPKKGAKTTNILDVYEEMNKWEEKIASAHGKNKQKEIDKENERHRKFMANLTSEQRGQAQRFARAGRQGRRGLQARAGGYDDPLTDPTSLAGIEREAGLVETAAGALSRRKKGKWRDNLGDFTKMMKRLTDEGGLFDQLAEAVETTSTRLDRELGLRQVGLRRVSGHLRRILGKAKNFKPEVDLVQIAQDTVDNLTTIGDALRRERAGIVRSQRRVNRQMSRLEAGGVTKDEEDDYKDLITQRNDLRKRLDKADTDILQNEKDKWEARVNAFDAVTDRETKKGTQDQAAAELATRIGSALGDSGAVNRAAQAQLDALKEQQAVVQTRLARAKELAKKDPRWQKTVDDLTERLNDLNGSIAEQAAEIFNSAVDAMDKDFSRRMAALDLQGRAADIQERVGDRLGAVGARQNISTARVGTLQANYAGLAGLRDRAAAEGRWDAFTDLSDKMADLSVQIDEENQTRKELIFTYRQTATDLITGRQERGTGLIATARDITQKVGELAGVVDTNKIKAFLDQTMATLVASAKEIAGDVMGAAGTGEFGAQGSDILSALGTAYQQGPQNFADVLGRLGPTIAALESTMGDVEKNAFQALIQAMIDNTTATVDTSKELSDLNGNLAPQSFTGGAWQWFREAIFTGMGDVLPQYTVPHAATGGLVARSGLMNLHAGELIVNPARGQMTSEGDLNITVNQDSSPLDIGYLASRMQFERKTARAASR